MKKVLLTGISLLSLSAFAQVGIPQEGIYKCKKSGSFLYSNLKTSNNPEKWSYQVKFKQIRHLPSMGISYQQYGSINGIGNVPWGNVGEYTVYGCESGRHRKTLVADPLAYQWYLTANFNQDGSFAFFNLKQPTTEIYTWSGRSGTYLDWSSFKFTKNEFRWLDECTYSEPLPTPEATTMAGDDEIDYCSL